nr:DUF3313 domain-containing protein [Mesorhizobium sp.]
MCFSISACTSVPLKPGASLTSYEGMAPSGSTLTKARLRVESTQVLSAKTVRIVPTGTQIASAKGIDPGELALVRNTIDRALCTGLSDRFVVVGPSQPADITVRASIVDIVKTNRTAAATSTVASLGASVALPVPIPRIPIGLGGLAVEAEAVGQDGTQLTAMLWSRGANMLTNKARVSEIGDAYHLSSAFGADFSRMLVTGKDPYKGMFSTPSMQKIYASLGGAPKYEACKAFGRAPGLTGLVTGPLGLPPEWIDKGAPGPR